MLVTVTASTERPGTWDAIRLRMARTFSPGIWLPVSLMTTAALGFSLFCWNRGRSGIDRWTLADWTMS